MSKQHRDFVILVRGKEEINALVANSHVVTTPATQTEDAFDTEHLTLVFIDPSGAGATTGEGLRNSIKTQIDVPPVDKGLHFGWREIGPDGPPPPPPVDEPVVTGEGKTQTKLDAELEAHKAERTPEEKALEPTT